MQRIDPRAAAAALDRYWSQQVLGEANGSLFKVAKGTGSTNWHKHDDQDEVFVVLKGHLTMQLRSGDVELDEGDMFIVPRGVEHCPKADAEVHLMLVGPEVTSNAAGGKPDWSYETRA
jgi:mannose-6-phosphate isomerase-like protein (cupin superfamily)